MSPTNWFSGFLLLLFFAKALGDIINIKTNVAFLNKFKANLVQLKVSVRIDLIQECKPRDGQIVKLLV